MRVVRISVSPGLRPVDDPHCPGPRHYSLSLEFILFGRKLCFDITF